MSKISKIGAGVVSGAMMLLSAAPVWAVAEVKLCPETGFNKDLCTLGLENVVPTFISTALFVAFLAAFGFLVYGGIKWILSGGDKEGTGKARGVITGALVGLAFVLGSWILFNTLLTFFGITEKGVFEIPQLGKKATTTTTTTK